MTRRTIGLLMTLALGFLWAPLLADAQPAGKLWRLGILGSGLARSADESSALFWQAFWQAMHERGWVEGHNITVEQRYAEGHTDRLPHLAVELVHLGVDVIVTTGTPAAQAAQQATATIPTVMWRASYPIETDLVASFARPGGNLTGVASSGPELVGKRLELLKETVPTLSRVGILWDPDNPGVVGWQQARVAAQTLGITVLSRGASIQRARAALRRHHAGTP